MKNSGESVESPDNLQATTTIRTLTCISSHHLTNIYGSSIYINLFILSLLILHAHFQITVIYCTTTYCETFTTKTMDLFFIDRLVNYMEY